MNATRPRRCARRLGMAQRPARWRRLSRAAWRLGAATGLALVVLGLPHSVAGATTTGAWGTPTQITGPGLFGGTLLGVSCTSPTDCTAAGVSEAASGPVPIFATESGGTWGPATAVASPDGGRFSAISCTDAIDCTAVGSDNSRRPIYATESGGVWSPARVLPTSGPSWFSAISCTDAIDCTAVGFVGHPDQPMYATEAAGQWSKPTQLRAPAGSSFSSISCSAPSQCTAVGRSGTGLDQQLMYAEKTAGSWGTPTVIGSSSGGGTSLTGVSCSAPSQCTAVGSQSNNQAIAVVESAGGWGAPTEIPGSNKVLLAAVSCTDATDCTAVGLVHNHPPLSVTETGGVWGPVTPIASSAIGGGQLDAVSCTSPTDCTAVGLGSFPVGRYVPGLMSITRTQFPPTRTTAVLRGSPNPATTGEGVTYTLTVRPIPNGGEVSFDNGFTPINGCAAGRINTSNGEATCHITYATALTHRIEARYLGNADFSAASATSITEVVSSPAPPPTSPTTQAPPTAKPAPAPAPTAPPQRVAAAAATGSAHVVAPPAAPHHNTGTLASTGFSFGKVLLAALGLIVLGVLVLTGVAIRTRGSWHP